MGADDLLPKAVTGLPRFCGEVCLPYLAANSGAAAGGEDELEVEPPGRPYRQGVFRYQVKCLAGLRRRLGRPRRLTPRSCAPIARSGEAAARCRKA